MNFAHFQNLAVQSRAAPLQCRSNTRINAVKTMSNAQLRSIKTREGLKKPRLNNNSSKSPHAGKRQPAVNH
jgi:hypothetical protein